MPQIREACKPKCADYFTKYEECVARVTAKGVGACDGQYFDYLHCIDKCVRLWLPMCPLVSVRRVLTFCCCLVSLWCCCYGRIVQSVPQIMKHLK